MKFGNSIRTVCLALLSAASGCGEPPARVEPPPPKVTVAHPETRDMTDYDPYNGWLDASATVEVRARVRGHIDKVHFTDGQIVKKGDLLFELDPRPFEADVNRETEQKAIYQAQLVAAQKEEARLKELVTRGGASQSQVDKAEADTATFEAQIKSSDEDVKRAQLDLEYSKITAPIAGKISRAMLTEGNLVNAGGSDPVLTTIVSVDPVYVYFSMDERALQRYRNSHVQTTRAGNLKESQIKIKFAQETDEGYPFEATLDFADNQVDRTTGTILVRGVVSNASGQLIPGSRVRIRVPMSDEHQVLLVPDTAVLTDQDKKYLLTLDDKNVVQRRDINPGRLLDDGSRVVLSDGKKDPLSPSDWLVVQGLQMARLNYPVDPVKPAATSQPTTTVSDASN